MNKHTPSGAEDFSEERFLSKLQRLLGKVCYSDNDVHQALEELLLLVTERRPLATWELWSLGGCSSLQSFQVTGKQCIRDWVGFRISFSTVFSLRTKTDGSRCVGGTQCVPLILLNSWASLWKKCSPLIFKKLIKCNILDNFYLKVSIYSNKYLLVEKWLSFFPFFSSRHYYLTLDWTSDPGWSDLVLQCLRHPIALNSSNMKSEQQGDKTDGFSCTLKSLSEVGDISIHGIQDPLWMWHFI